MVNINYDDYTEVVNQDSVENIMKAMGYDIVGNDFIIRDYIIQTFGHRDSQTKNKDIINAIMSFDSGFYIGKGLRPKRNLKYITEDGVEWSYDSQANMDIIDDILENQGFHCYVNEDETPNKNGVIAMDKTRSYCLDLMSRRKYSAKSISSIAAAYNEGYLNCLEENG